MQLESVVYLFDLIGTSVFAVTGALAAIEKRMDIFGVIVLAAITALGGGTLRDILMDRIPPFYFYQYSYLAVAVLTAVVVFLLYRFFVALSKPIVAFDALGLGVFTIIGAQKAVEAELPFLAVLILAMLTGIGGGMMRDILRGEIPFVLKKEIYASASMLGAVVFWLLSGLPRAPVWAAMVIGMFCTVSLRLLSVKLGFGLPVRD